MAVILGAKLFFANTVKKHSYCSTIATINSNAPKGDSMHLDVHLKKTGQNQSDFGATLNPPASQALVSQWVRGVTRVTLSYALQIERVTKGQVTPQDCADMYRAASPDHALPSHLPA